MTALFTPLPPRGDRPFVIDVTRGSLVESRHLVDCAVADAGGTLVARWGDIDRPVYPRSSIKSLQAIPLVESGAAAAFGLGDAELALACASHGGEAMHVEAVTAWLERLGLDPGTLECGAHWPSHLASSHAMVRSGMAPTPVHNNCSGKHTGMLCQALHHGDDPEGYIEIGHAVQRRVAGVLSEMTGADLEAAPVARDGCSIPTYAMPLAAVARGMARYAAPDGLGAERAAACRRLHAAIRRAPLFVAGHGRYCSIVNQAAAGKVLVKTGAEGMFTAAIPDAGLGVALKVVDGAGRAAEAAMTAVLAQLGHLPDAVAEALAETCHAPITNWRGFETGALQIAGEGS